MQACALFRLQELTQQTVEDANRNLQRFLQKVRKDRGELCAEGRLVKCANLLTFVNVQHSGLPTEHEFLVLSENAKALWLHAYTLGRSEEQRMRKDASDDKFRDVYHFKDRAQATRRLKQLMRMLGLPVEHIMRNGAYCFEDDDPGLVHMMRKPMPKKSYPNTLTKAYLGIPADILSSACLVKALLWRTPMAGVLIAQNWWVAQKIFLGPLKT